MTEPTRPDRVLDLHRRFAETPYAFGFYQAMRRLEAAHRGRPRFGRAIRPEQEPVRLGQEPSLLFAPSTLQAWTETEGFPPRLLQNFFGVFGPNGPLPMHLTEFARDRRRNFNDPTFQRFADIFHHRALSLFYRAWANCQPTVSFDRPDDDRFAFYVGSLIGLGMKSLRNRDAMPDLTKLHFAGHMATQTRHAEGLGSILSSFFIVKVRVACFIGAWLSLQPSDWTRLADRPETATLGGTTLIGRRVWSRQHKFRIVFGPLTLPDYMRLLPGGASFRRLVPIVRNYAGDTLAYDVNLVLKRDEVPAIRLGRQGLLGWTTWLMPRRSADDAADLFLDASAEGFARKVDAQAPPEPPPEPAPPPPPTPPVAKDDDDTLLAAPPATSPVEIDA